MKKPIEITVPAIPGESSLVRRHQARPSGADSFRFTMDFASSLARTDPLALPGFAYLIGRRLQANVMTKVFGYPPDSDSAVFHCDEDQLMFRESEPLTRNGRNLNDLKVRISAKNVIIDLSRDIILPWPWELDRVSEALSGLRKGGEWGKWRQDRGNHLVIWWSPLNIAWVHGGNHSILAGIAYRTGKVVPEEAYDISPVYRYVRCDGVAYRRMHDNSVVARVKNVDFAILFEIGRLIHRARRAPTARRRPGRPSGPTGAPVKPG